MAKQEQDIETEEDPASAAIVRKMRLFVGVSFAIMAVGVLTVMSVIVWRLVKQDPVLSPPPGEIQAVLPIGKNQRISGTTSDGTRLFVTVDAEDGRQAIFVFDAATLVYRGKIESLIPAP